MAYERKKLRYTKLAAEAETHGWKTKVPSGGEALGLLLVNQFFSAN